MLSAALATVRLAGCPGEATVKRKALERNPLAVCDDSAGREPGTSIALHHAINPILWRE